MALRSLVLCPSWRQSRHVNRSKIWYDPLQLWGDSGRLHHVKDEYFQTEKRKKALARQKGGGSLFLPFVTVKEGGKPKYRTPTQQLLLLCFSRREARPNGLQSRYSLQFVCSTLSWPNLARAWGFTGKEMLEVHGQGRGQLG